MQCTISGLVPKIPVISVKSGHLFEKDLIEKHIQSFGTCPETGEELSLSDLMPIVAGKVIPPKSITATSVPGMLSTLQNEWDALMLESYELKKNLHITRQQLSQALYENDACYRVIARLVHERDTALEQAKGRVTNAPVANTNTSGDAMVDDESNAPTEMKFEDQILATASKLGGANRSTLVKELALKVPNEEELSNYKVLNSQKLHTKAGITCVDMKDNLVITGGNDKKIYVFNQQTDTVISKLSGHKKQINSVQFHPTKSDIILSSSCDNTAGMWQVNDDIQTNLFFTSTHTDNVTSACFHPSGSYFATSSVDMSWKMMSETGTEIYSVSSDIALEDLQFHPDGALVGVAHGNDVYLYDVNTKEIPAKCIKHNSLIKSLTFSPKGYQLASVDEDGVVEIWDIRKQQSFRTIETKGLVQSLSFDPSGTYLAFCQDNTVQMTKVKKGKTIHTWQDHTNTAMGIRFSADASSFVSVSLDQKLNVYRKA